VSASPYVVVVLALDSTMSVYGPMAESSADRLSARLSASGEVAEARAIGLFPVVDLRRMVQEIEDESESAAYE